MKSRLRMTLSVLLVAVLWYVASLSIQNDVILPRLDHVLLNMVEQARSFVFYQNLANTLLRMIVGFAASLMMGVSLGLACGLNKTLKDYVTPIITMIKSIPNISYMIIVLLWFNSTTSVIIIVFLIIFPMFYEASVSGVLSLRQSLFDVLQVYSETKLNQLKKVYIPAMLPFVLSNSAVALNLSFKVAIMAEVLGQPLYGIGKGMLISKLQLDMIELFSWTGWIILFGLLFDYAIQQIIQHIQKKYL